MTHHSEPSEIPGGSSITLRGTAELVDALPYLLGFHPDESIVLVALHGEPARFGGRVRMGIPEHEEDWAEAADQIASCLITSSESAGGKPDGIIVFLCHEPVGQEAGSLVMERLRPLAQRLRLACGALDVPVAEALCVAAGQYWSYTCVRPGCCESEGNPLVTPGSSVLAASAVFAGVRVAGSLRAMEARLEPWQRAAAVDQEAALDTAGLALVPRILGGVNRLLVEAETLDLARLIIGRFAAAPSTADVREADQRDDELLAHDEAAALILGLQDRETRDRAAAWMEGDEAWAALRLWRALARRCVRPYVEHAAAPLTLAGWVAWSLGELPEARVSLGLALRADPRYTFAVLLHEACNQGMDPEEVRSFLRAEREGRDETGPTLSAGTPRSLTTPSGVAATGTERLGEDDRPAPPAPPAPPRRSAHRARRVSGGERRGHQPHGGVGLRPPGGPPGGRGPGHSRPERAGRGPGTGGDASGGPGRGPSPDPDGGLGMPAAKDESAAEASTASAASARAARGRGVTDADVSAGPFLAVPEESRTTTRRPRAGARRTVVRRASGPGR
ncbi:DUF4192 domain-containing protein [Streptomyces tsukubensis]|uniref:DUF4192 domain-containing protein n=1 Tax=Streptomyces tsukubensis TaxID=83656 RepID=A0A1V4A4Y5_9ACTN|nr:DUF4192 domain-containing protein [Streptomyces tsukubensis]OON75142.1 hypothetical protein B1H18_23595 [Streptomyces tsukubensis]